MKKQLWSVALAALLTMSTPASHAFDVGFSANGPGNSVVFGYLNLIPTDWQLTPSQWADGTQVHQFTGHASPQTGWVIEERDGLTISGGSITPFDLQLSNFLFKDGTSRVDMVLQSTVAYSDTLQDHSRLDLSMVCQCSDLFTPSISAQSFERRDALAGRATLEKQSVTLFPDGHKEINVDSSQQIVFGAVPEPDAWALVLAGAAMVVASARYRKVSRKLSGEPSRGTALEGAASGS